jgi:hypothetical protein
MVEAVKGNVLPASRLPKVIEAWEEPKHEEFAPRTAWSLFNALHRDAEVCFAEGTDGGKSQAQFALSPGAIALVVHSRGCPGMDGLGFRSTTTPTEQTSALSEEHLAATLLAGVSAITRSTTHASGQR